MGWGIIVKEVELRRVHKSDLVSALEDREETMKDCRERLLMLVASTPVPISDGEGNEISWVDWSHSEVSALLRDYEDAVAEERIISVAMSDLDSVEDW